MHYRPSKPFGGSLTDTELDHQIIVWQKMGVRVHICHVSELDLNCHKMRMADRGCIYHKSKDWKSIDGLHAISFCNGGFLDDIKEIKKYAKTTTFVNCMTWNFPKEIEAQKAGLIDFHLYQTDHAMDKVSVKLANGPDEYRPIRFKPYFHTNMFQFHATRRSDEFKFGRISRGDADKFNTYQFKIYEGMVAPVPKKGLILGWDKRAKDKLGTPPSFVDTYTECARSQRSFYEFCDAIILASDTYENLPRVGFEAMASGSVLVVDNRGGWKLQVEDGETGFLCNDPNEFIYKSSKLAYEHDLRNRMRQKARQKLEKEWGMQASIDSWDHVFSEWEKIC
tara:strand:- start:4874 stop:5884 length:1011 start_codon:yes stop_codon:yes gene_type:complete